MGRTAKGKISFPGFKVKPETIESLKQTAIESGFTYGDGAAMGELLDRLAEIDRELLKVIIKRFDA
jgi:hypothetical protein